VNLGQLLGDRSTRRERLSNAVGSTLQYYLGPTGIPDRLATLNDLLNPVDMLEDAGAKTQTVFDPNASTSERIGAGIGAAADVASAVVPAWAIGRAGAPAATAVTESLLGIGAPAREAVGDAAGRFAADQSGAIRDFHGSPHDFDRFSMDKIGTGEGAQAYGHGLYFADNEAVARSYRDDLSKRMTDGKISNALGPELDAQDRLNDKLESIGYNPYEMSSSEIAAVPDTEIQKLLQEFERLEANRLQIARNPNAGRMYEVEINANPEDFLDWDAPLSAQPERVRGAFEKASGRSQPTITPRERGGFVVEWLEDGQPKRQVVASEAQAAMLSEQVGPPKGYQSLASIAGNPQSATQQLREAGIPGIRYLDAGSRGAQDVNELRGTVSMWETAARKSPNDPYARQALDAAKAELAEAEKGLSRNYVVFDENLINIVRKYGIAGAATMLGMTQADLAQAMEQPSPALGQLMTPQGDPETEQRRLRDYLEQTR